MTLCFKDCKGTVQTSVTGCKSLKTLILLPLRLCLNDTLYILFPQEILRDGDKMTVCLHACFFEKKNSFLSQGHLKNANGAHFKQRNFFNLDF